MYRTYECLISLRIALILLFCLELFANKQSIPSCIRSHDERSHRISTESNIYHSLYYIFCCHFFFFFIVFLLTMVKDLSRFVIVQSQYLHFKILLFITSSQWRNVFFLSTFATSAFLFFFILIHSLSHLIRYEPKACICVILLSSNVYFVSF